MQQKLSASVIRQLMKKYKKKMGAKVGDSDNLQKLLRVVQKFLHMLKKVDMSEKKQRKSENELLNVVSKFAYDLKHEDQMALSAAFMVAAKTIYINQLGLEQTQDLFQAMADSIDILEIQRATLH
jgi:hypothetical protein